ncbi:low temperature requirement protein A [Streptomyces flaveus]|uniref:low temperature requirement protein A n=1 Tax=Streptomyces flaveus TaxID=66370 RepID=UPI003332118D
MRARDPAEPHRAATPLELLFDLCFVVAVAQVAAQLHHAVSEDHASTGVLSYFAVFFAIWWAWMGFTWFASAYDIDDVAYRLAVFVQIAGVLVLASGVPRAFADHDFTIPVVGYTVMRLGLVALWLRAARAHPEARATTVRYAAGLVVVQCAWIGWLFLPDDSRMPLFAVLALFDLAVPVWAEAAGRTPWHPHHIAERFGLFTLIVLGESVLAATTAVQQALDAREATAGLYAVAAGGLLIVLSMWWLYFAKPAALFLTSDRAAFPWGYGHYLVFGSAAAVGAGLAVNVDHVTHHSEISDAAAGAAVTVPVAVFLLVLYLLHIRPHHALAAHALLIPGTAVVVLALTFTDVPVPATGVAVAALAAVSVTVSQRRETHEPPSSRAARN